MRLINPNTLLPMTDAEALEYWDAVAQLCGSSFAEQMLGPRPVVRRQDEITQKIDTSDAANWPHTCPRCKGPALVMCRRVDCKAKCTEETTWR